MLNRPRIRQLSLGELLDESFRLYRSNFLTFVAIAALVLVPYSIIAFLVQLPFQERLIEIQAQTTNPNAFAAQSPFALLGELMYWYIGIVAISLLYMVIFQPLLEGALTHNISQSYLGHQASVGESFGAAVRRSPALIVARLIPVLIGALIFGGIVGGGALIAMLVVGQSFSESLDPGAAAALVGVGLLGIGLLAIFTLLALALMVRILFTSQAVMVENAGAWQSLTRSWRLTQGNFWRLAGNLLTIGLLMYILVAIPSFVISFAATILGPDLWLQTIANTAASAVLSVISTPFSLIAYTLLYFDLRVRKEGFDLEYQASTLMGHNMGMSALESQ